MVAPSKGRHARTHLGHDGDLLVDLVQLVAHAYHTHGRYTGTGHATPVKGERMDGAGTGKCRTFQVDGLHRDGLARVRVERAVHRPVAPFADFLDELVAVAGVGLRVQRRGVGPERLRVLQMQMKGEGRWEGKQINGFASASPCMWHRPWTTRRTARSRETGSMRSCGCWRWPVAAGFAAAAPACAPTVDSSTG